MREGHGQERKVIARPESHESRESVCMNFLALCCPLLGQGIA